MRLTQRIHEWLGDRLWFSYEGVPGPLHSDDGGFNNWSSRGIYVFGRNWTLWSRANVVTLEPADMGIVYRCDACGVESLSLRGWRTIADVDEFGDVHLCPCDDNVVQLKEVKSA